MSSGRPESSDASGAYAAVAYVGHLHLKRIRGLQLILISKIGASVLKPL